MGDDIFEDMSSTVFGKTPFSFLEEVSMQNRRMSTDSTEEEIFSSSKTIKTFVSTITIFHSSHDNIIVKGPPAQTKQQARHAAAVEVFKHLGLNRTWLQSAQTPIGGRKWHIPDESFLLAGSKSPPSSSSHDPIIAARVSPVRTSPTPSLTSSSPPASVSSDSEVCLEWIVRLTAYCSKMKIYSTPIFTDVKSEGPANEPTFTVECEVRHSQSDVSRKCRVKAKCKKKVARQIAAQGVFMKIRELDGVAWDGPPMPNLAFILEIDDVVNVSTWPIFEERMQNVLFPVKSPPLLISNESDEQVYFDSQYLREFDPVQYIGRGAFGTVFEAKKKIDDRSYAVKRISLPNREKSRNRVMREVKALARLDHRNIVRYFNAWIENPPIRWLEKNDPLWKACDLDSLSLTCHSYTSSSTCDLKSEFCSNKNSLSAGKTEHSELCAVETTDEDSLIISELESTYLYIQQELCQKQTLQDWLRFEPKRVLSEAMGMFFQLVEAVEYIHANHLIHRDLKPSNIFLAGGIGSAETEITVKIGDFGLATTLLDDINTTPKDELSDKPRAKLTGQVGTELYMAPELAHGKPYNHKVDIFSLGLIFFELLVPLSTDMEKYMELHKLRQMEISPHFVESFPEQVVLIQNMVTHDPSSRPDASEIKSLLSNWYLHHYDNAFRSMTYPERLRNPSLPNSGRRKSEERLFYTTHSAM